MEVTVQEDDEGRAVVHKAAPPPSPGAPAGDELAPARDLAAEADWLRRAAGEGTVRLAGPPPAPGQPLVTVHGGSHTWHTAGLAPPAAAEVAADLLRILAGLHRRGLVHGALTADHVLIGPDGPVLCSPRPDVDDPGEDRRSVADLLARSLEGWKDEGRTIRHEDAWQRAIDLLRRPDSGWTLGDVAAVLAPGRDRRRWWPRPFPPSRRRVVGVGVGVGVGVVAVGLGVVLGAGPALPLSVPGRSSAAPQRIVLPAAPAAAGSRPGLVAATETPCPGSPPAATLDPATGRVWAYPARPTSGEQVRGEAVQRVPGASGLEVTAEGTCERIVAVGPAGQASILPGKAGNDRLRPG